MCRPSPKAFDGRCSRLRSFRRKTTQFNMNHCNTLPGMPKLHYTICVSKIKIKIHQARMRVRTVTQQQDSALPSSLLASAFGSGSISPSILICSCRGSCVCSISPLIVMEAESVFKTRSVFSSLSLGIIPTRMLHSTDLEIGARKKRNWLVPLLCRERLPMSLRPQTCTSTAKHCHKVAFKYEAMLEARSPDIAPILCHCYCSLGFGSANIKIPSCQSRFHSCYSSYDLHPTHEVCQIPVCCVRRTADQETSIAYRDYSVAPARAL